MRAPRILLLALSLSAFVLAPGCARRGFVVDGVEMDYDAAARTRLRQAMAAWQAREYDEAVRRLRAWLQAFPKAEGGDDALYYLADSLTRLDRPQEAAQALSRLLAEHPRSERAAEARLILARRQLAEGRPDEALRILEPAVDRLSGDDRLEAVRLLARAAVEDEDWERAVRWVAELEAGARSPEARAEARAALLTLIDDQIPPVGLARLAESLPTGSAAYPLVLAKLARLHYHLGDHARAQAALDAYLRRFPDGEFAEEAREMAVRLERLSRVRPTVVGLVLPLSGQYQAFGEAVMRGVALALDDGAGRAISLLVRDSEGDPQVAARAVEDLVFEDQVVAVIGPLLSTTALAAAAKAEELGVPLLTLSRADGLPQLGPWIFRNALTNAAQARALVAFAEEHLGAQRFALLYPGHNYGESMADLFWSEVEERRHEMRAAERYAHDQTTFSTEVKRMVGREHLEYRPDYQEALERIRTEVSDPYRRRKAIERARDQVEPITDFDVVFVPDSYKTVSLVAPALAVEDIITNVCDERDLDRIRRTTGREELHTVRLLGSNTWHNPDLVSRGGKYVNCAIFVDGFFAGSRRPATADFVARFHSAHGEEAQPTYFEAVGWDSARMVAEIIARQQPRNRAEFRERLGALRAFPGATGATAFGPEGEAEKPLFFLTVEEGAIVEVDPATLTRP